MDKLYQKISEQEDDLKNRLTETRIEICKERFENYGRKMLFS